MNGGPETEQRTASGRCRRWLLALDPVIEGGRHGQRAQAWDVEDELIAVALLGDVTIDLSHVKSAPAEIDIEAYAIFRDVDVLVAGGSHVELSGGVLRGDLSNDVPAVPEEHRRNVIRIHGHALFGDVTARMPGEHPHAR
jgi:autonomous glycyl radical cofactor GrcA